VYIWLDVRQKLSRSVRELSHEEISTNRSPGADAKREGDGGFIEVEPKEEEERN